jgi:transketolase
MGEIISFQEKAINTIRYISADSVQKANSAHPGLPIVNASIVYTIWTRHQKFNPSNPFWFNRDHFVLSGELGSLLLYSLLYLEAHLAALSQIHSMADRLYRRIITINHYRASTPGGKIFQIFGFTKVHIIRNVKEMFN